MSPEEQFPTSFRFTAADLARLDELAGLIYERMGARVAISRKAALLVALDLALAEEHARAQIGPEFPGAGRVAD